MPGDADIEDQVRRFGGRLRRYRTQAGLSQLQLAERAGVDLAAVSFLERAKRAPNLGTLVRVASAAGVSAAALVSENDSARAAAGTGRSASRNGRPGASGEPRADRRRRAPGSHGQAAATDPLRQFGANLRQAREAAGLSQEALAHTAHLDRAAISIIEHGGRAANLRTILKLSAALGLTPAQLLAEVR